MTLQGFSRITFAMVAALVVALVVTLGISTRYTGNLNEVHARSLANVSAALSMEVALFEYNRDSNVLLFTHLARYAEAREAARNTISTSLETMAQRADPEDGALVKELGAAVQTYFATRARLDKAQAPSYSEIVAATEPSFSRTESLIARLVTLNRIHSEIAFHRAALWDRIADAGALTLVLTVFGLSAWYLTTFSGRVYAPLSHIRTALAQYKTDPTTRLPEHGFEEVRQVAAAFNTLAASQQALKERQLGALAGVAHDLKTPLTTIKGYLELYKHQQRTPTPQVMEIIGQQIDRLTVMVHDLLDAQIIEAGQIDLRKEWHDLGALAGEAVAAFREIAPQHAFVTDLPGEALQCYCDALRVSQVLNNLLSNAVKYSPQGGTIRVGAAVEGDAVVVAVEDEGIGIAAADMAKIFEPFQRAGASRLGIPGSGLGLATTKKIVEAHGGAIRVASVPGKGSRFEFTLPR